MKFSGLKSLQYKKRIYWLLHIIILILSLFLIISISIDTYKGTQFYLQSSYMKVQLWICIWFIFSFFLELILADRKWRYIWSHLLFFLISIPYINIINYFGWTFSSETTYLIRFIPLVRGGYALAIVVGWLTYNKASSLFVSYLTMLVATIYFSSLVFYVLEHKVNPLVNKYGDALWWAWMDVTTVGSNISAMTITGRILAVLLAALGMMMFPIFTVYVTNLVQMANKKKAMDYKSQELATDEDDSVSEPAKTTIKEDDKNKEEDKKAVDSEQQQTQQTTPKPDDNSTTINSNHT